MRAEGGIGLRQTRIINLPWSYTDIIRRLPFAYTQIHTLHWKLSCCVQIYTVETTSLNTGSIVQEKTGMTQSYSPLCATFSILENRSNVIEQWYWRIYDAEITSLFWSFKEEWSFYHSLTRTHLFSKCLYHWTTKTADCSCRYTYCGPSYSIQKFRCTFYDFVAIPRKSNKVCLKTLWSWPNS